MATIRDVANLADVSVATVSFVLNDTKPVSEQTRRKVLRAIDSLRYRPNALAQGLASRRSGLLAMLYPSGEHRTVGDINDLLSGATEAASNLNHTVVLWPVNDIDTVTNLVRSGLTDGIVITRVHLHDPRIDILDQIGIRYIPIGRTLQPMKTDYVDIDFEVSARECLQRLADLGHRRIAYVGPREDTDPLTGYGPTVRSLQAMNQEALSLRVALNAYECDDTPEAGRDVLRTIMSGSRPPTAIVSSNPRAAFGIRFEAEAQQLHVPTQLSIFLFNSISAIANLSDPVFDQMISPARQLGVDAVTMLVHSLKKDTEEPKSRQALLLPCTYKPGQSIAPSND